VREECLRLGRRGRLVRPFCEQARLRPRSCSLRLQRALVDFGADDSFREAVKKIREHYGVDVSVAAARQHTLAHAKAIGVVPPRPALEAQMIVTGLDGSMVPIVESGSGPDRRKGKTLQWKQANLCCARAQDRVECVYGATLSSVKMSGLLWREVACAAGLTEASSIHAVADGADPIFNAFNEQFGAWGEKARFTVDYYHVHEHLSVAAGHIAPASKAEWLHRQHGYLLNNEAHKTLRALARHREPAGQEEAPVRAVYQYLHKRKDHLDYAGARAAGLPFGSGETESAHRHVIQQRLKIAGAWWAPTNAEGMLRLRTTRANHDWDRYWTEFAKN
jgi:hypothetical protein